MTGVVVHRVVHGRAVVPQHHLAGFPTDPDLELGPGLVGVEEREEGIALFAFQLLNRMTNAGLTYSARRPVRGWTRRPGASRRRRTLLFLRVDVRSGEFGDPRLEARRQPIEGERRVCEQRVAPDRRQLACMQDRHGGRGDVKEMSQCQNSPPKVSVSSGSLIT